MIRRLDSVSGRLWERSAARMCIHCGDIVEVCVVVCGGWFGGRAGRQAGRQAGAIISVTAVKGKSSRPVSSRHQPAPAGRPRVACSFSQRLSSVLCHGRALSTSTSTPAAGSAPRGIHDGPSHRTSWRYAVQWTVRWTWSYNAPICGCAAAVATPLCYSTRGAIYHENHAASSIGRGRGQRLRARSLQTGGT
jgi:hypothetical protein